MELLIQPEDDLYISSFNKAKELWSQMNKHAPDGTIRSDETIFCNCFAGALAELSVIKQINALSEYCGYNIVAESTIFDKNADEDQIDILIKNQTQQRKLEIRSSYGNVQNNSKRYNEWFSIVGCYTTDNKSREITKDYYITVIFNFPQEKMIDILKTKKPISLQIAGGCDKNFLFKYGIDENLNNNGAKYKVIRPIVKGYSFSVLVIKINQDMNGAF